MYDTVGVALMEATPIPGNARVEVLGGGRWWQWRWSRAKGGSSYGGKFELLPVGRQAAYLRRRLVKHERGDEDGGDA